MTATKTKSKAPPAKSKKSAKVDNNKSSNAAKGHAEAKPKKLSALDAAAKILAESGKAMNCKEMIDAMAKKGYWTSPGGATPWATLYSAILRELKTKGKEARFKKAERGKFRPA
jgi:HB1, ASXL, restriction endonuclease HTH domain